MDFTLKVGGCSELWQRLCNGVGSVSMLLIWAREWTGGACTNEITKACVHEKLQLLMCMLLRMVGSAAGKAVRNHRGAVDTASSKSSWAPENQGMKKTHTFLDHEPEMELISLARHWQQPRPWSKGKQPTGRGGQMQTVIY